MDTKKFTVRDYMVINFIIFLLVAFLSGFFVGAKIMEKQMTTTRSSNAFHERTSYTEKEIIDFYYQIFSPVRSWNQKVSHILSEPAIKDSQKMSTLIDEGNSLKNNLEAYTFESPYLTEAVQLLQTNIEEIVDSLLEENPNQIDNQFNQFLSSQKEFYRNIWVWEQFIRKANSIEDESVLNWAAWENASIHQKNYIVAALLEKTPILTFEHPENIMVHIDAYYQAKKETAIRLESFIEVLVSSESVQSGAFLKHKDKYQPWIFPEIPDFTES